MASQVGGPWPWRCSATRKSASSWPRTPRTASRRCCDASPSWLGPRYHSCTVCCSGRASCSRLSSTCLASFRWPLPSQAPRPRPRPSLPFPFPGSHRRSRRRVAPLLRQTGLPRFRCDRAHRVHRVQCGPSPRRVLHHRPDRRREASLGPEIDPSALRTETAASLPSVLTLAHVVLPLPVFDSSSLLAPVSTNWSLRKVLLEKSGRGDQRKRKRVATTKSHAGFFSFIPHQTGPCFRSQTGGKQNSVFRWRTESSPLEDDNLDFLKVAEENGM